ncbi:hypothetical protein MKW92_039404 [Papaver armeniacum]|nr:hypothetical protein MKW92_039404 [Papaver armeniacum]
MGLTRRSSFPDLFASACSYLSLMTVWLSIQMSSATTWANICTLGETYTETSVAPPHGGYEVCTNWCESECKALGSTVVQKPCINYNNPNAYIHIQCCCSKPTPPSSSSPSLPPTPSSFQSFDSGNAGFRDICTSGQTYLTIEHSQGVDCVHKSQCENKCNEKDLVSAGSQCVGALSPDIRGVYTWTEQCCCKAPPPSPPPPPPSPPPPSPPPPTPPPPSPPPPLPPPPTPTPPSPPSCSCCGSSNVNINIQIS